MAKRSTLVAINASRRLCCLKLSTLPRAASFLICANVRGGATSWIVTLKMSARPRGQGHVRTIRVCVGLIICSCLTDPASKQAPLFCRNARNCDSGHVCLHCIVFAGFRNPPDAVLQKLNLKPSNNSTSWAQIA